MWTQEAIKKFHAGSTAYIEDKFVKKKAKIDCADLALEYLLDFARENNLPVSLRYYSGTSWETYVVKPKQQNFDSTKAYVKRNFGALNVIDNTEPIDLSNTNSGDLIMSKWSGRLGHTRIIVSVKPGAVNANREVTFYQGNLPPVVPEKKTQRFGLIDFGQLKDKRPRRWKFASFK